MLLWPRRKWMLQFRFRMIYVYMKVKYTSKSERKGNVARTAGIGTWVGKAAAKTIKNQDGEVIGHKRLLTYTVKEEEEEDMLKAQHGHWSMHEYTLADIYPKSDFVICKIAHYFETMSTDKDRKRKFSLPLAAPCAAPCATKKLLLGSSSTSTITDQHEEESQVVCNSTTLSTKDIKWLQGLEYRLMEDDILESTNVDANAGSCLDEYARSFTYNHESQIIPNSTACYANGKEKLIDESIQEQSWGTIDQREDPRVPAPQVFYDGIFYGFDDLIDGSKYL